MYIDTANMQPEKVYLVAASGGVAGTSCGPTQALHSSKIEPNIVMQTPI